MPRAIIPSYDPQDRLEQLGPMAVRDAELLGVVIGKPDRAEMILSDYPKESLVDMTLEQLVRYRRRIEDQGEDTHRRL